MSSESVERRMILTPRQITIAGIFGGLAMICTGLGLALPGYLPLVNFELQGTFITIATMAAGPIAGMIVSILAALVSAVGIISAPFYWPHIFVLAALYPYVYNIKNKALQFVMFWILTAFALFIQYWGWWWLYAAVFALMTVEAMFWYNMLGGAYIIYLLIWGLIPSIVLVTTPKFVRPDWKAPGIKWIALISAIIVIALGLAWWGKVGW